MAIVNIDPAEWQNASVVQIESDAPNNIDALKEIENWAYQNGFARTTEYWLRHVRRNGKLIFRGICYRVDEEDRDSQREAQERIEANVKQMPVTAHSFIR